MEEEADYVPLIGYFSDLTPVLGWFYSKYFSEVKFTACKQHSERISGRSNNIAKTEVS